MYSSWLWDKDNEPTVTRLSARVADITRLRTDTVNNLSFAEPFQVGHQRASVSQCFMLCQYSLPIAIREAILPCVFTENVGRSSCVTLHICPHSHNNYVYYCVTSSNKELLGLPHCHVLNNGNGIGLIGVFKL